MCQDVRNVCPIFWGLWEFKLEKMSFFYFLSFCTNLHSIYLWEPFHRNYGLHTCTSNCVILNFIVIYMCYHYHHFNRKSIVAHLFPMVYVVHRILQLIGYITKFLKKCMILLAKTYAVVSTCVSGLIIHTMLHNIHVDPHHVTRC